MARPIFDPSPLKSHPQGGWAWSVAARLRDAGFEVLLAGGCVRDLVLGRVPHDLDLVTSARPEQIEELFEKTVGVGKAFGVIRVLGDGQDLEVATYREDGAYVDGRRPTSVRFASAAEDAARRDFTVNALFLDPWSGEVHDHVGGLEDLGKRVLRTVGVPEERFREDKLRLLRTVRFAAELDFVIAPETWNAVRRQHDEVRTVSPERVREETGKMLRGANPALALRLLDESGLREVLFPEMGARAPLSGTPLWREAVGEAEWVPWGLWMAETAASVDATNFARRWRFSRADEQGLAGFLRTLQESAAWSALRPGERLRRLALPGVRWALRVLELRGPETAKWSEDLREFARMGGLLPEPLLRGADLQGRFQGARLGEVLQQTYLSQLEGCFGNREQALAWVEAREKSGAFGGSQ